MTKSKIQNKFQIKIPKQKPRLLCFVIWIYFVICALSFGFTSDACALDLDKVKTNFLNGEYKAAITEGEKILGQDTGAAHSDELYYLLGLAYLKDGNYLRASDIFEIVLQEFKESRFADDATLGLGDSYFLQGNYDKASQLYKNLITPDKKSSLVATAYYRLSQCAFKSGNTQEGKDYLDKLKLDFPMNADLALNRDLCFIADAPEGFFYTIQVGAFNNQVNSRNFTDQLVKKGYAAYMEEVQAAGKSSYRVKVGKLKSRQEALALENKLSQEGYPTKICP